MSLFQLQIQRTVNLLHIFNSNSTAQLNQERDWLKLFRDAGDGVGCFLNLQKNSLPVFSLFGINFVGSIDKGVAERKKLHSLFRHYFYPFIQSNIICQFSLISYYFFLIRY